MSSTASANNKRQPFAEKTNLQATAANEERNIDIDNLTYRELQQECILAGVSARGKAEALRERLRSRYAYNKNTTKANKKKNKKKKNGKAAAAAAAAAAASSISQETAEEPCCAKREASPKKKQAEEPDPKRQKTNINKVEDGMICPITCYLPNDPVMAEDGHIYEKSAIEEYFRKQHTDGPVKSPMTGKMIHQSLLPALQHRNTIETLIENGTITGELADAWKKREKESKLEKHKEELFKKARRGDSEAMVTLADNYHFGINGFEKDEKKAFEWTVKADAHGNVWGTASMGQMLASGSGCEQNNSMGVMFLGVAAGRGCDWAAYRLGVILADGKYGIPVDKSKAIIWLKKSLSDSCETDFMSESDKIRAKKKLDDVVDSWLAF